MVKISSKELILSHSLCSCAILQHSWIGILLTQKKIDLDRYNSKVNEYAQGPESKPWCNQLYIPRIEGCIRRISVEKLCHWIFFDFRVTLKVLMHGDWIGIQKSRLLSQELQQRATKRETASQFERKGFMASFFLNCWT